MDRFFNTRFLQGGRTPIAVNIISPSEDMSNNVGSQGLTLLPKTFLMSGLDGSGVYSYMSWEAFGDYGVPPGAHQKCTGLTSLIPYIYFKRIPLEISIGEVLALSQ
jgi:hypothetical protein